MLTEKAKRVIIENVKPRIDGGTFPIKRVVGENVFVSADIFADGHDALSAVLLYKKIDEKTWNEISMSFIYNDVWQASFCIEALCTYVYTLKAWVDHFKSWQSDLRKKFEAGQDIKVELLIGKGYIEGMAKKAKAEDAMRLKEYRELIVKEQDISKALSYALSDELSQLAWMYSDRKETTTYEKELKVMVRVGQKWLISQIHTDERLGCTQICRREAHLCESKNICVNPQ